MTLNGSGRLGTTSPGVQMVVSQGGALCVGSDASCYGNMYLNISSKDREIASLKLKNNELNQRINKIDKENKDIKKVLCELSPDASICS